MQKLTFLYTVLDLKGDVSPVSSEMLKSGIWSHTKTPLSGSLGAM